MKYLKRFNDNVVGKSSITHGIHQTCKKYGIENYTINDDGTIDVKGGVYLYKKGLTELPLKFGKVTRYFTCTDNQLTSLEGCPTEVGDFFACDFNQLTSLIGGPEKVGSYYDCDSNQLTSLKGSPKKVGDHFNCNNNKLVSLMDCPDFIGSSLYCDNNPVEVIWDLFKSNNRFLEKINHIYTDLHLGNGWTIQGDIIEQIAEELDVRLITDWREVVENVGYKII